MKSTFILQGEATTETDERMLNEIFATRSFTQLKLTCEVYRQKYQRDMQTTIDEKFSGSIRKALLAIGNSLTGRKIVT